MKTYPLTKQDKELIRIAKEIIDKNYRRNNAINTSVGCALMSNAGKIYKAINIQNKVSYPVSLDAEEGVIDQMFSAGCKKIKTMVSVHKLKKGYEIFQPCGHCRQLISQFGNPFIIISNTKKVKLKSLFPLAFSKWTK